MLASDPASEAYGGDNPRRATQVIEEVRHINKGIIIGQLVTEKRHIYLTEASHTYRENREAEETR